MEAQHLVDHGAVEDVEPAGADEGRSGERPELERSAAPPEEDEADEQRAVEKTWKIPSVTSPVAGVERS